MRLNKAFIVGLATMICSSTFAGVTAIKPKLVVTGLSLPTCIASAPGDKTRLFVLEKRGTIRIIDLTTATPTLITTPFLDIDAIVSGTQSVGDEQGMLCLAFDPDYSTNGQFYVYYTGTGTNNLARYTVSASNPNIANTAGVVMMTWADSFSNHNGGSIQFKPGTRNLYMGTGDGGSANDPSGNSQNLLSRHGKMHRITPTVGGASPYYTIPTDNPFVGGSTTADDTVWSYGLRNAWRSCFDRANGDLYIADVGQNAVEEVNYEPSSAAGDASSSRIAARIFQAHRQARCTFDHPCSDLFDGHHLLNRLGHHCDWHGEQSDHYDFGNRLGSLGDDDLCGSSF